MNLAALYDSLRDKAVADNASATTLFNGAAAGLITGFFYEAAPNTQALPYVIFNTASDTEMDTFSLDVDEVVIRMAIYVARSPTASGGITDPVQRMSDVEDRLRTVFHRQSITVSGATATSIIRLDSVENHTDDRYCLIVQFKIFIYK